MKFRIRSLTLDCIDERETVEFDVFTYLHGPIGAGKSTIAKLVNFCLGGRFSPTPVLQPIFVGASLQLVIAGRELTLDRKRDSNLIRAMWTEGEDPLDLMIPSKAAGDVVLPGSEVAVLSDLFFHLAGIKPPKVRRGRQSAESDLVRLSFRDLFKYCYLDQDSMDNSFFNLDEGAGWPERNKARDVLRFLVGFHQEKVAELESELENLRNEQTKCEAGATALHEALSEEKVSSAEELAMEIEKVFSQQSATRQQLTEARHQMAKFQTHAVDTLQKEGREMSIELEQLNRALVEIAASIEADRAHRNSLRHLAVRQRRALVANEEFASVGFIQCPQCTQTLPPRSAEVCAVCGQFHNVPSSTQSNDQTIEADIKSRADELDQRILLQRRARERLRAQREDLAADKSRLDHDLNEALKNYDSAYLSTNLQLEKQDARLGQRVQSLRHLKMLSDKIVTLKQKAKSLADRAASVRIELKREREFAEKDRANITLLQNFFLDCVIRSGIPGITSQDVVQIASPHFLPNVLGRDAGNLVTTNYSNMSSGGKKNLFKCCFAIAMHRLARQNNVILPTLLIIDSPMKNISERTNNPQFVGFNEMLYELAVGELEGTQFIVIDKEFYPPSETHPPWLKVRRMTPDDPQAPPLLTKHVGRH